MKTMSGTAAPMRFALYLPNAGYYADVSRLLDLACAAENSGWDGLFLWDHLMLAPELNMPVADSWTAVTAILTKTKSLISGPIVTPLPRRRPAKVAQEAATLDRLSGGRLVLGAGLGAAADLDFARFGEEGDARIRAQRLDEALEIIDGLWRGDQFTFSGEHHKLDRVLMPGRPWQQPRIPLWLAATWPHQRPLRRAARWDGVVPLVPVTNGPPRGPSALELTAMLRGLPSRNGQPDADRRFDVAVPGVLRPGSGHVLSVIEEYARAGATWWLESFDPWRRSPRELTEWIRAGPPRFVEKRE
jgi:alkanesulfonate monooxygenase SsuD/methylene tetrahydromethanopterin reductase-like flavin-dependent oxidoreductase (luciferase family)